MSYTDKKITQEEINAHHVQGATDYLIGNAQQNKAVFDDLPEFIAGKFNDLIDEIAGQHGDEIKVAVDEWLAEHPEVTTTVQDNSLTTAKYVDGSVTPTKLDRAYSTPADLASVNENLTNELNVLDARMDEFASLPEGSTSGNAELVDIRVGADGKTYQSAGGAVRGQVADLKSDLNLIATINDPVIDLIDEPVTQGYLNASDGSFTATSGGSTQWTTDAIVLEQGVDYTLEIAIVDPSDVIQYTTPRAVCVYNLDNSYSRYISIPADLDEINLSNNESYIRVNYNLAVETNSVKTFKIYPTGSSGVKVTLNENVVIPQLEQFDHRKYIGARRCAIAFILDGDYDLNATMEDLFYANGVKIGFAPQYTTNFPNNSKETYLAWQAKGHEILAHSSYTLTDGAYDDDVAKGYIKSAYTTFTGYGFVISGLIGSGGKIADKYIPTVEKYFRYCASENNHSGSYTGIGAEPCLYFGTNAPFHLWRYSMQTSTLQQMKDAVDRAIDTTGLLLFYGHAQSTNNDNFTSENVQSLLEYIASKAPDISIMTPSEAINEYYTIRYDDVVTS